MGTRPKRPIPIWFIKCYSTRKPQQATFIINLHRVASSFDTVQPAIGCLRIIWPVPWWWAAHCTTGRQINSHNRRKHHLLWQRQVRDTSLGLMADPTRAPTTMTRRTDSERPAPQPSGWTPSGRSGPAWSVGLGPLEDHPTDGNWLY